jgi:acetolactate synthase-1/2/3 large subunit
MNIQELATAKMYNVAVKIVLFHNGFLGMVRQWQELFYEERYASSTLDTHNPDFMKVAEGYGIEAKKINRPEQIEEGIDFLLKSDGPCILEVMIPQKEMVYPMIASGKKYEEMIEFDHESEPGKPFSIIPHRSRKDKK